MRSRRAADPSLGFLHGVCGGAAPGGAQGLTASKGYDAFLSYNQADSGQVREIASRLVDTAGLKPFLDAWYLTPGSPWQEELEEALELSKTCVVFLGPTGAGPWEREEMRAALEQRVATPDFRVIPVLLEGASAEPHPKSMPPFLRRLTWVDMDGVDGFDRLVAGIRGMSPRVATTVDVKKPEWLEIHRLKGELANPTGIRGFSSGFFICDHTKGHLLKVEDSSIVARLDGLNKPHHLEVLDDDKVLIANTHEHEIICTDWDLNVLWRRKSFASKKLRRPHGVRGHVPNEFFLLDSDNARLLHLRGNREVVNTWGPSDTADGSPLQVPCGLTSNAQMLLVADTYNHRICAFTHSFEYLGSFGAYGNGRDQFAYPVGIDSWQEMVLIADEQNQRLQLWEVQLTARRELRAHPVASNLFEQWLMSPFGISISAEGRCYIADRVGGQALSLQVKKLFARYR